MKEFILQRSVQYSHETQSIGVSVAPILRACPKLELMGGADACKGNRINNDAAIVLDLTRWGCKWTPTRTGESTNARLKREEFFTQFYCKLSDVKAETSIDKQCFASLRDKEPCRKTRIEKYVT